AARWRGVTTGERASAQSHCGDLCRMLGEATPSNADPTGAWYAFEKGAEKLDGRDGFADVWKKGFFAHDGSIVNWKPGRISPSERQVRSSVALGEPYRWSSPTRNAPAKNARPTTRIDTLPTSMPRAATMKQMIAMIKSTERMPMLDPDRPVMPVSSLSMGSEGPLSRSFPVTNKYRRS